MPSPAASVPEAPKPGRMPRRWWLFILFDLVARYWPVRGPKKGALVLRVDGIGDMVLFQPAFAHYAEALGLDLGEITILGCHSWERLAPEFFPGCRFHAFDEHAYDKNPFYRFKVSLWLRRRNFAVATCDIFMRKPLVADSLIYVSGAERCIVTRPYISPKTRRIFDWYLKRCHRIVDTGPHPTHEVVRHFRFLSELLGRDVPPAPPVLPRLARSDADLPPAPYALINFGANEPGRRWPFDRFVALADDLAARGLTVVFVGGPAEADYRERLAAANADRRFIDRIGGLSFAQFLDLLQNAALVVTNETGPAHLSIGLGAPTVVIVGGGQFRGWTPFPDDITPAGVGFAYRERPCFYCLWRCTEPHEDRTTFPCIEQIPREDVLAEIDRVLAAR